MVTNNEKVSKMTDSHTIKKDLTADSILHDI
jgi:hypothetical protein